MKYRQSIYIFRKFLDMISFEGKTNIRDIVQWCDQLNYKTANIIR